MSKLRVFFSHRCVEGKYLPEDINELNSIYNKVPL